MQKLQLFEDFAYTTPERNRVVGSPGLVSSQQYVLDTLNALGDYYDIETQNVTVPTSSSTFSVDGVAYASMGFLLSPPGNVTAPLAAVANLGCDAVSSSRSLLLGNT